MATTMAEEAATTSGNLKISTSPILKGVMSQATRRSGVAGIHVVVTARDSCGTVQSNVEEAKLLVFPLIYALE